MSTIERTAIDILNVLHKLPCLFAFNRDLFFVFTGVVNDSKWCQEAVRMKINKLFAMELYK